MARKTVSLEFIKERVNTFLAESPNEMQGERRGMGAVLESALFETHTYKGFRYLSSETKEDGTLKQIYDDSRREYL